MIDAHVHIGGGVYASAEAWSKAEVRLGIDGAVLVQRLGSTENQELLAAKAMDPERRAIVAIPARVSDTPALLEAGVAGVRTGADGLHGLPGDHTIFEVLSEGSSVASVTGPHGTIASPAFAEVVDRYPEITFRLEHLAALPLSGADDPVLLFRPIAELARRHNVVLMWSGLFHFSGETPPYTGAWSTLETSLDAFGPDRIMWSGDWNRAGGSDQSYSAEIELLSALPFVGHTEHAAISTLTAARVFSLGQTQ